MLTVVLIGLIVILIGTAVFCLVEGVLLTAELKLKLRSSVHRSGYKAIAVMWFILTLISASTAGFLIWLLVTT